MPNSLEFEIPVRTVSEANQREHHMARYRRKVAQQTTTAAFCRQWLDGLPPKPWRITLTRYGPRLMDRDNNAGSFKHVQDQLAREIGIDDGDEAHDWLYRQKKRFKREGDPGVGVRIETLSGRNA